MKPTGLVHRDMHNQMIADRDAEIARLRGEVERHLRCTSSYPEKQAACARKDAEIARLTAQIDLDNVVILSTRAENRELRDDLAAHLRALAAGPAALRDMGYVFLAEHIEAAQEAALKEKP